ncbi:MAG TPA: Gfo/Idh/MocA family oxidoreductase, partial [Candidatus Limnocylindria bacterium]|nr:Gfo/Idh/MocA family oxidoreductase [Candidatus Limnocylindria bacterium]
MIIVDQALAARAAEGNPVRVGMIGAGAMGRGIARQMLQHFPGLRLVAIANRTPANAARAYADAGAEAVSVESVDALEDARRQGRYAITDDATLLCDAPSIEILIEVTGTVEYAAGMVLRAFEHGKDVVLMNAELDGTIGPILAERARAAGVRLSACDGDQPGVEMNLYRFVKSIGLQPVVCGNIKGLQDRFRNPTTQKGYAEQWGLGVEMVTSFADGTKVSFEQAIVANATGMRAPQRGLYGWEHREHVDALTTRYDPDALLRMGGIVDYVIGAQPAPGIYVIGHADGEYERHMMALYKRGDGPLYCFYTPQHLCHFEVPISVGRVALCDDIVLSPLDGPMVDVVAVAKRDLRAGERVDYIGGYMTYGTCENSDVTARDRLLPMGLADGCLL